MHFQIIYIFIQTIAHCHDIVYHIKQFIYFINFYYVIYFYSRQQFLFLFSKYLIDTLCLYMF